MSRERIISKVIRKKAQNLQSQRKQKILLILFIFQTKKLFTLNQNIVVKNNFLLINLKKRIP